MELVLHSLNMAEEIHVPEEIIIEILSRLPVKSIIRFRSVSRSWKSITVQPRFIKKHLNQSTKHNELRLQRALLRTSLSSRDFVSCHVSCLSDYNLINEAEELQCPLEGNTGWVVFLGSCNGLLWIKVSQHSSLWRIKNTFLWNPSTREIKKLSEPPYSIPVLSSVLGYDSCNDDYKIIVNVDYSLRNPETVTYSLKTDSWTITQDSSPYGSCTASPGKFVNGACHWLKFLGQDSSPSFVIVSYDLSKEKYGELPCPDDQSMPVSYGRFDLAVLRGMLCIYSNFATKYFTLWAMEDYGVEKSWTQMFKFEYLLFVDLVPKFLFDNGEFLLEASNFYPTSSLLAKYKDQGLEVVARGGRIDLGDTQIYLETLVSPALIIGTLRQQ